MSDFYKSGCIHIMIIPSICIINISVLTKNSLIKQSPDTDDCTIRGYSSKFHIIVQNFPDYHNYTSQKLYLQKMFMLSSDILALETA